MHHDDIASINICWSRYHILYMWHIVIEYILKKAQSEFRFHNQLLWSKGLKKTLIENNFVTRKQIYVFVL